MKNSTLFLFSAALVCFSLTAHAQTAPPLKGKTQPAKQVSKAPNNDSTKVTASTTAYILKDTAEFNRRLRRSSRPSNLPIPTRPIKK